MNRVYYTFNQRYLDLPIFILMPLKINNTAIRKLIIYFIIQLYLTLI